MHPKTPDGRYLVVNGQLWRCKNPSLSECERQRLVHDLMDARREIKRAKRLGDSSMPKSARSRVDAAKVELGERCVFGRVRRNELHLLEVFCKKAWKPRFCWVI